MVFGSTAASSNDWQWKQGTKEAQSHESFDISLKKERSSVGCTKVRTLDQSNTDTMKLNEILKKIDERKQGEIYLASSGRFYVYDEFSPEQTHSIAMTDAVWNFKYDNLDDQSDACKYFLNKKLYK